MEQLTNTDNDFLLNTQGKDYTSVYFNYGDFQSNELDQDGLDVEFSFPFQKEAENQGFNLLKRMGWVETKGIGRNKPTNEIPIFNFQPKTDRQGLNEYNFLKEREKQQEIPKSKTIHTSSNVQKNVKNNYWNDNFNQKLNSEVTNWEELSTSPSSGYFQKNMKEEEEDRGEDIKYLIAQIRGCEDQFIIHFDKLLRFANNSSIPESERKTSLRNSLSKLLSAMEILDEE